MVGVDVGISVGTVDGMYVGAIDGTEVFTDVAFEVEVSLTALVVMSNGVIAVSVVVKLGSHTTQEESSK
jgi:hypothetical protein